MPGSSATTASTTSTSTGASSGASAATAGPALMFVYRHSAALTEADDLRDAILLFHPQDTPLEKQCILAGQLMGTTGFIRAGLLSQPAVFDLDNGLRVACAHSFDSDLTLCIGVYSAGSDAAVRDAVAKLHLAMQLYCGPLALAFWTAQRHRPDLQDRLTPLAGRLLSLYCPSGYPHGMLALASGRIRMLPLQINGRQRQLSARQQKQQLQQRQATASLSRLLLAGDCLADRIATCCSNSEASSADVLGCAVFAHDANNSISLISSTGLPTWLYAALSIVAAEPNAEALPLLHPVVDLPPPQQSSSAATAVAGVDTLAFHAFLPAEDWPAGLQIDFGGGGSGGQGKCLGRCERHRSAPPRLSSMCEAAVLASRVRQLSSCWPVGRGCVRCQCVVWLPKHPVTPDGAHLRIVAVVSPKVCVGCVCSTVAPLLTLEQLRPLSDAFATAAKAGVSPESLDSSPNSMATSSAKPLIFCPPLAAPSSADIVQRFPEDASLALASLVAADVTSTTCQDVNTASLASAFSIRVDGQMRVSASRSDGLLTLSDTIDLSYYANYSLSGASGLSAGFPRRRRGVTPRASVSGSPLAGDSAGGSGSGGLLAVPPTSTTPRRSRSFIGSLRPVFRKL